MNGDRPKPPQGEGEDAETYPQFQGAPPPAELQVAESTTQETVEVEEETTTLQTPIEVEEETTTNSATEQPTSTETTTNIMGETTHGETPKVGGGETDGAAAGAGAIFRQHVSGPSQAHMEGSIRR